MTLQTGGAHAAAAIAALGVDHVFVVASVHNLPILQALHDRGATVIDVRHEQAAVHAADGYARATGRVGVALTSTGPGAANSVGGLFEASFASSPVLMLTGQVESHLLGRRRGFLHEAERQPDMLRSVTKATYSVTRASEIADMVLSAGRQATAGRPGPIAVEIPIDLQYAAVDVPAPSSPTFRLDPLDPSDLSRAAALLRQARRPFVWAGGGVVSGDAGQALRRWVEDLDVPVVTTTQGRGALPEDHPLCLGPLATSEPLRGVLEEADAVLAVGTRFQMQQTDSWTLRLPDDLIHVDVDPDVFGRTYRPAVALTGDAATTLEALRAAVPSVAVQAGWTERCTSAAGRARELELRSLGADHRRLVDIIRTHLPRNGAVVRDSTIPAYYWGDRLLPILQSRTSMNPAGAAIGPGLPLALGATLGRGERSVVLHGDGGIMLTIQELATLAQYSVPLTVCVFNDGGYGILRAIQGATFPGEQHDVDLLTPDFVQLASSMHVPGERVDSVAAFEQAFARSTRQAGPYLIEVDLRALEPIDVQVGTVGQTEG